MATISLSQTGTFTVDAAWRLASISVTNTSTTQAATVKITDPCGQVIFTANLPAKGNATLAGVNPQIVPAGTCRVDITGAVNGSLTTASV